MKSSSPNSRANAFPCIPTVGGLKELKEEQNSRRKLSGESKERGLGEHKKEGKGESRGRELWSFRQDQQIILYNGSFLDPKCSWSWAINSLTFKGLISETSKTSYIGLALLRRAIFKGKGH